MPQIKDFDLRLNAAPKRPMGWLQRQLDRAFFDAEYGSRTRRFLEPILLFLDKRR